YDQHPPFSEKHRNTKTLAKETSAGCLPAILPGAAIFLIFWRISGMLDSIKRAKFFCHCGICLLIWQLQFLQKMLAR
ncbi:MAG: hypothetical protein RBQ91_08050, partial [Acholeplasma sp.]|nr:hypothetical protein [Acholeplasma sp.]